MQKAHPEYNDSQKIRQAIAAGSRIAITTHNNPDGDALGAGLAFGHYLRAMGKIASVIVPNDFPPFLSWMPGTKEVLNYARNKKACIKAMEEADLVFCLDFNGLGRTERMESLYAHSNAPRILIDHHLQPDLAAFSMMISKVDISSTSELVYLFIEDSNGKSLINKDIAECIYVGIITDTGSFSYACNYRSTYRITADLIEAGVDGEKIHRLVYDTYSENRMRLLGFCLSERMKVMTEFATAYIYLSKKDLKQFDFQVGDTEGVVNYALSINGMSMAALFTEREGCVRISVRSKGSFSVNEFMRANFEGGGHRNAAGGNSFEKLPDTLKRFESLLPSYRDDLLNSSYD